MLTLDPDRFLVLGHRGASAYAQENSIAAFRLAATQGADGVELDVRRSADGQLMVHHDATVPGLGPLIDHTFAELSGHDEALVTFSEAMEACEGLIVNVEIKNSPMDPDFDAEDRVAAEVVDWLHGAGWSDQVIVSSFNPATVDRVRRLSPQIATGQLIEPGANVPQQLVAAHQHGHQAIHPHITSLTDMPELASIAAGLGMWLFVWTVDEPEVIRSLRDSHMTGVITNDPAGALAGLG